MISGPAAVGKTSVANEVSAPVIETDERTVPDIAAEIVELIGWC